MAFIKDTLNKIILGRWRFLNLKPLISENIRSLAIDENGNLGISQGDSDEIEELENRVSDLESTINEIEPIVESALQPGDSIPNTDIIGLGGLSTKDTIDVPTDITATGTPSANTYLRGDGSWATPSNTTYTVISETEFNTGTSTTARTVSAVSLNRDIQKKINDLIPAPPVSGTFVLTSTDGVISWVEQV